MIPAVEMDGSEANVQQYLSKFHQNIGFDSTGGLTFKLESAQLEEPWSMFPNAILNEAGAANISDIMKSAKDQLQGDITTNKDIVTHKEIEYKKVSNMTPSYTNVHISFVKGSNIIKVAMPIGVKTQVHTLDPVELDDHIMDAIAGKGMLNSIIRWSTGEMLSLKDILFGANRIKKDLSNSNSDTKRWFSALERRKRLADLSQPTLNKKAFLPNTSVIISMDEVHNIKRQVGFSMLDIKVASKFMKDNMLLAMVIVDDMTETLFALYDGHSNFDEYTYSSIERDNAKHDKEMSTLIKTIGKLA
jgi:hypothetical protein